METTRLTAPDIECDGCANAIKRALGAMEGVTSVEVDVPIKAITVQHEPRVQRQAITATLDRAGFPVVD